MTLDATENPKYTPSHVGPVLGVFAAGTIFVLGLAVVPEVYARITQGDIRAAAHENCFIGSYPLVDCGFTTPGNLPVEYVEPVRLAQAIEHVKGSRTPLLRSAPDKDSGRCLVTDEKAYCFADDAAFHLPPVPTRGGGYRNAVSLDIDTIMSTFPGYHEDRNKMTWVIPY